MRGGEVGTPGARRGGELVTPAARRGGELVTPAAPRGGELVTPAAPRGGLTPALVVAGPEALEAARAFYGGLLGFEEGEVRPDAAGAPGMVSFTREGAAFVVATLASDLAPPGGVTRGAVLAFEVPDVGAVADALARRGLAEGAARAGEAPWGRWLDVQDPAGNTVRYYLPEASGPAGEGPAAGEAPPAEGPA